MTLHELGGYKAESITPLRQRQVTKMSEHLRNAKSVLKGEEEKVKASSKEDRFIRAKRVSETLDELVKGLERLKVRGVLIDGFVAHQAALLQSSANMREGSSVPQCNVPPAPDNLVLNLNNSATYEGQLKQKALSDDARTVGAVGARVAAAEGMSGVIKPYAVTALGNDCDAQDHYSDGIYFLLSG